MKITDCQVNHLKNPIGYVMKELSFSYHIEETKGKQQTEVRIQINRECPDGTRAEAVNTGWIATAEYMGVPVQLEMEPRTRYVWTVTARTDAGEEAQSDENFFETGKMDEEWAGSWLTLERGERIPVFSKEIPVNKPVSRARLYICGLGLYEAYLTKKLSTDPSVLTEDAKIGQEMLAPYCNNYDSWVQYQTYDITEQIKERQVLNVWLGEGWYMGRFGFLSAADPTAHLKKTCRLMAEVVLDYADGTCERIGTDESWKVWHSNMTFTNIYDGEQTDDTLPQDTEFTAPALCTEAMPALTERYSVPVKVEEIVPAKELITTPAGEKVFDFGQNLAGGFALHVRPKKGDKIHIQFGEILQNGNFYRDNLRTAKAEYWYTSDGTEKVIKPRFTYYGYRYMKVEGVEDLSLTDAEALVYYSEMDQRGFLKTGHEKINQLISNAHWGLKGNFIDVPTDCPQRDERMGWTADAQVFAPTASYYRDTWSFYRKYLHDMETEQQRLNGMVPIVVPAFGVFDTVSVWGDAATIMPWSLYRYYGDIQILRDQYKSMRDWVEYIRKLDGEDNGWGRKLHLGDWLALDYPGMKQNQVMGGTDEAYIAYVYYANSAEILAKSAELLAKDQPDNKEYRRDEREYSALTKTIKERILDEYFSKNGRCAIDTQTGLLIALRYGITPNVEKTVEQLQYKFIQTEGSLQTGFVGTPHLLNVLTEQGMEDLAYHLLLQENYPGWIYEIDHGATTVWERWNSVTEDGSISSTGMNSLNHYAYGSVVEWIFSHMAGLMPQESFPGFKKVRIAPVYDEQIGTLELEYRSAAGKYLVSWKTEENDQVELHITVPFGCEAEIELYGAEDALFEEKGNPLFNRVVEKNGKKLCVVGSGTYQIRYHSCASLLHKYMDKLNRVVAI